MTERIIYKIIDSETGENVGAYSRAYHTEYEFSSPCNARSSNVHDIYKDKLRYKIQKWKVTYELVEDDCDPFRQAAIPYYKEVLAELAFVNAMKRQNEEIIKILSQQIKASFTPSRK